MKILNLSRYILLLPITIIYICFLIIWYIIVVPIISIVFFVFMLPTDIYKNEIKESIETYIELINLPLWLIKETL